MADDTVRLKADFSPSRELDKILLSEQDEVGLTALFWRCHALPAEVQVRARLPSARAGEPLGVRETGESRGGEPRGHLGIKDSIASASVFTPPLRLLGHGDVSRSPHVHLLRETFTCLTCQREGRPPCERRVGRAGLVWAGQGGGQGGRGRRSGCLAVSGGRAFGHSGRQARWRVGAWGAPLRTARLARRRGGGSCGHLAAAWPAGWPGGREDHTRVRKRTQQNP